MGAEGNERRPGEKNLSVIDKTGLARLAGSRALSALGGTYEGILPGIQCVGIQAYYSDTIEAIYTREQAKWTRWW